MFKSTDTGIKLAPLQKGGTAPAAGGYGGLGAKLPAAWRFFVIFLKTYLF